MSTTKQENQPPPSKRPRMESDHSKSNLEDFINIPGLQHLAENIFLSLNYDDLMSCQTISKSSKAILDNPMFWLKKFIKRGLSKKNQKDWKKAIQMTKNTKLENNVLLYLKKSSKHQSLVDFPCYIDENVVLKSLKISKQIDVRNIRQWNTLEAGYIQIFASLSKNPNDLWYDGHTPIGKAAKNGNIEFLKCLAPLTKNPNQSDENNEDTPIHFAASNGHVEIIQYLVSLNDVDPNIPNKDGKTPLHLAADQCYLKRSSRNLEDVRPYYNIWSILKVSAKNRPVFSNKQNTGLILFQNKIVLNNRDTVLKQLEIISEQEEMFLELEKKNLAINTAKDLAKTQGLSTEKLLTICNYLTFLANLPDIPDFTDGQLKNMFWCVKKMYGHVDDLINLSNERLSKLTQTMETHFPNLLDIMSQITNR